jgi:hypothetical protein
MTTEEIIIAVVRILGSLPVLIWPLPGAVIAMLTDQSDLFMMNLIHAGGVRNYQEFDKALDQVYMLTFLAVAVRWRPVPRNIAIVLYIYRLIGDVTFELTDDRLVLFVFPNLFEFWFVFVAGIQFFHLEAAHENEAAAPRPSRVGGLFPFRYALSQLAVILPILLAAKLFQEYALHVGRWLDGFTAVEAVRAIWQFVTPPY